MLSLQERLEEILLKEGLLSKKDLQRAIEEQKACGLVLSQVIIKLNLLQEEELTRILSQGLNIPLIDISRIRLDPQVVKLVPRETAVQYQVLPISRIGEHLTLAMADPLNILVVDNIKTMTGLNVTPVMSRRKQIQEMIERYYEVEVQSNETFEGILQDIKTDTDEIELIKLGDSEQDVSIEDIVQDAPLIKLTDTIIQQAVLAKASDVFVEPLEKTLRIRYRVDGLIREVEQMSKALHLPIISRFKIISNLDISEHRVPQDGRFKTIIAGKHEVDFRVNVLPTAFGEKVVLRVLDKTSEVLDIEKLGFQESTLKRIKSVASKPHGMILSCGPTGSGKTTTLYSILKFIDSPEKNIVTVEDPVEYEVKGINQVNVRPAVGLTFATALRSILRQDPDVILIGEIRDTETLDIAVKAALTGHLVLSSLHTTTAAGSVVRMMNMGIEPFLLCSSVIAILGQRLLRRVCTHCREAYQPSEQICQEIGLTTLLQKEKKEKKVELFKAKGCKKCFQTGYSGRVGISEILVLGPKVKDAILHRQGEMAIKRVGREEGMQTMREDGLLKVLAGLTTLEEVLRVTAPDEEVEEKEK
ncbi:MAG: ATPase, T2SS/T4P/T4SS family [Candidatus Omnitrophica bacterium]|nr:ATPase, T2SS/T4P/T4SS family [Candidatus Omnitrophota bacterium]